MSDHYIYQSPTSRSPFIYPLTLRLRKPRSWSHVAAVQQNTDRDYGAHSRLQIQMLYSTLATGQRSRGVRTTSLYTRVGTADGTDAALGARPEDL